MVVFGFRKFLLEGMLLEGSRWFQTSAGFFKEIFGSPLPIMKWMELRISDMDGGWGCGWGVEDMLGAANIGLKQMGDMVYFLRWLGMHKMGGFI